MQKNHDGPELTWPPRAVGAASGLVVAIGLITLVGYRTGQAILTTVLPGSVPMAANTALMFVTSGVAMWLVAPVRAGRLRRRAGQALALATAAYAGAILSQYLTGRSLGLDLLLFADQARAWSGPGTPGRFSPHTGVTFILAGLAMVLLDAGAAHGYRYARTLASVTAVSAVAGLTGRAFGLQYLYESLHITAMAIGTATAFVALSAGLLASRADRPLARLFAGDGLGSMTVRRLAPAVAAAVLLAGVLFTASQHGAIPGTGAGVSISSLILVLTLCVVFVRTGRALNAVDREHQALLKVERDEHAFIDAILQSLPDGLIAVDPAGTVLQVSHRWSEITGFAEQDALGRRPPYPWWPAGEAEANLKLITAAEAQIQIQRPDGTLVDVMRTTRAIPDDHGGVRMRVTTVRDVTAHNRAQAEQRRHAEQLNHYFQLSADLMCIAGADGYFKRLNPAWKRTLGYTEEELSARPFIEFIHPDDIERTAAETAAQRALGLKSVSFENRYRCRDGSYRWLQWNAIPQGDMVYAVARDTTVMRQATADQARLAAIVDSSDSAIISKTLDGTITSWNRAAERIFGCPADEAIGRSIRMIFDQEYDGLLAQVRNGEPVTDHEIVWRRPDGVRVPLALTVSPIRDSAGVVVGAASIASDSTERHKAAERFRRLLQAAPDAMMIAGTDGTIVLVNRQAERLFGYPAADLIGQPVEMLMSPDLHDQHRQHRTEYMRSPSIRGMGTGMELAGRRRDGTEFPIEVTLAPLDTDEGALVSASIRDVSQRKQIERDLATARDDALAAAQVKSQFVAMVSHEIRTPMNGVIGLTALLMKTPLQSTQRRYVESIRASGRALLSIINDILDFSKMESGKIVLADEDFALDNLIEEVVQIAAEAGRGKNLQIQSFYLPDLPTRVRGDEGRLRQVLLNLLGNAIKFTEQGEVVLRTEPVGDRSFTFSVTDTGIGISAADLAGLFEPFSQVDAAADREFGGTGLGLSICEQLVHLMGGHLKVISEPGNGSQFSFTIPLTVASDNPPFPRQTRTGLRGRRLLVVDASAARSEMVAEHCRAWGLNATVAVDGESALGELRAGTARAEPFEVAVIDQHLPDIAGVALTQRITADTAIHTPMLVLLTSGSYDDEQIAVAAGATTALSKPIGPSQLYNGLIHLLDPEPVDQSPVVTGRDPVVADQGLVLLAEDNTINQLVAVDTLEMLGYRVDVACNGLEAVELAAANIYLAVLMDCQMPKMDGFAATAALRRHEGTTRHTPIIAMTAGALSEDRDRCIAAGMDDYLSKPIDPDQLSVALQHWIQESRAPLG